MDATQSRHSQAVLRDVLRIAKAGIVGQVPFVLVSPALTRLYSPAQIGIYGLAMAFVGVAAPVAGLRFELAAISASDAKDSRNLLFLSAFSIVPVALLCGAALYALKAIGVASYQNLTWPIVASSIACIWAAGMYATMRCSAVRRHEFGSLAASMSVQGILRAAIPLLLSLASRGALMLLAAELLSRSASMAVLVRKLRLRGALTRSGLTLASLSGTVRRFWKYPLLLTPSALIDAAAMALPVPIVAACYGLPAAGEFALVQRLVMLPAAFMVRSVGDVYHAHATRVALNQPGEVRKLMASTAVRLALVAIAIYAPLAGIAPLCAGWVFGHGWRSTGMIIAALTPTCIAQTIVSPLSRGLLLARREERKLIADVAFLVLPSSALYLSSGFPLANAVLIYSAGSVVAFGIYFAVIAWTLFDMRGGAGGHPDIAA